LYNLKKKQILSWLSVKQGGRPQKNVDVSAGV
jgi:hypothetical protein